MAGEQKRSTGLGFQTLTLFGSLGGWQPAFEFMVHSGTDEESLSIVLDRKGKCLSPRGGESEAAGL